MKRLAVCVAFGLTIALVAACGKAADEPSSAGSDTAATRAPAETAAATPESTAGEPVFAAVDLPAAFPTDFPIAPESTVIEATSRPDSDGILSRVSIVSRGEPRVVHDWYSSALAGAGWMLASEVSSGDALALRATQGESYVDLATEPHPVGAAQGWVRTRATIWKTER